jgi:threonine dehydrogenase-like Zn-dependent dehydrogenase
MKAVVYNGPRDVSVKNVPDVKIEQPTDVLVKITSTNICGSDLHMYEGRTDFEQGRIFGHENLGEVVEVGSAVDRIKVGDMVCLPFNIGCGFCRNCEAGLTAFCLTTNPTPGVDGAPMASPTWDLTAGVRPSISGFPTATSTACGCRMRRGIRRSNSTM